MKIFFKILLITALIQILGFTGMYALDAIFQNYEYSTTIPVWSMIIGVVISTIFGIVLPLKWCYTLKSKLLTIFLMPTNYTWLVIIITSVAMIGALFNILINWPSNLG